MPDKLTLYFGRPHLSRLAAEIARQALDVPTRCTHVPAPCISALHPEAGSSCEPCFVPSFWELVDVDTCVQCGTRPPLPTLLNLPTGDGYAVLTRLCDPCCLGTTPQDGAR
ncbi:hypothetical protein ACIF9R_36540 [Streptomyces sp. NPDC086080]|uniref:hypothetical protein n=1 Tax=Streptomyces sp. NPDC086080 TaxID=3365748 RepID=UPI0037D472C1